MNTLKNIWNNLAEENAEAYIASDATNFREKGKSIFNELILADDLLYCSCKPMHSTFLEVGCGIGRITEFIADIYKKVYAVDVSEIMIAKGKERLSTIDNIVWIVSDGIKIPKYVKVDIAFSYLVYQHCTKDIIEGSFREVYRCLKDGGLFKVQIRGKYIEPGLWCSGDCFTLEEASKLANDVGFRMLKYSGLGEKHFWLWLKKE